MKREEICAYWVGLLDGDGSIQINHCNKKYLQYRLVIKLKNLQENEEMLRKIGKYIGGRVLKDNEIVRWIEDDKERIKKILDILEEFPPLTNRLRCQINFMKECFKHGNVEKYLKERGDKYFNYIEILDLTTLTLPAYFPYWLSGFIEAESCFNIRSNNKMSFSIGKKDDKKIIEVIKKYFDIKNKILIKKNNLFLLEVYNKSSLLNIINHCTSFSLIGYKNTSFIKFKENFFKFK